MNIQYPKTPENTRIYAIGDVHGRRDLFDQLLQHIAEDAKDDQGRQHILVMLGDYIDRGPDSRGVLDRLEDLRSGEWLPGFTVHLLKGNHEDCMMSFLANMDSRTWLACGGAQALRSYGLDPKQPPQTLSKALLKALPKAHRDILRSLKFSVTIGDYAFVHAGVRPGIAWSDQDPNDLVWIRAAFLDSKEMFDHMIVHGHSPTKVPTVRANRIGIDTEAWASGTLTCLVLQGAMRRFIST
jgi:serine/threonine protein phosphatase 1